MPYRRIFNGKTYRRIACWREKFMAEGYAATLRLHRTAYPDIKVESSDGWWCVYGRER